MALPDSVLARLNVDELVELMRNGSYDGKGAGKAPKRGEDIFEGTDYPREWAGFIGQAQAKEQLIANVVASRARGKRMEHTLLASGIHGVGKTTLATLLAFQRDVGLVQTTGPLDVNEARTLMTAMQDRDVLFIDEAHLLVQGNRTRADWLLPFMTEGKLYTETGAQKMPDITLVAATTDVGKLPRTLISRFMVRPKITAYTDDEATHIVANLAARMDVEVPDEFLPRIAQAANKNPRDVRMILTQLRDLALAFPDREPDLGKAFEWAGLSADGLDTVDQDFMLVLLSSREYTASIDSLGAQLGEPGPLKHHEQNLLQRGFIEITGRGRKLTHDGVKRAVRLLEERTA
jgi:Holliday junction DNA helicase RuvB